MKSTGDNLQLQPLTARTWVSVCREERLPSLAVHRAHCETPGTKGGGGRESSLKLRHINHVQTQLISSDGAF